MSRVLIFVTVLSLWGLRALAHVQELAIDSKKLNAQATNFKGNNLVYWDDAVQSKDLLVVTIGGTNSQPSDMKALDQLAAQMAYQVVAVDYDNHTITTDYASSSDPLVFDNFRRRIVLGATPKEQINSIVSRIQGLVRYLNGHDTRRWGHFLNGMQDVDWSRVVVIGFSQGSGDAAYLGKIRSLRGVFILAGPQDHYNSDGHFAPWVSAPGLTPPARYYSFLHRDDPFGSADQVRGDRLLMNDPSMHVTLVDRSRALAAEGRIFMTERQNVGDPHVSLIQPVFSSVWQKILRQLL